MQNDLFVQLVRGFDVCMVETRQTYMQSATYCALCHPNLVYYLDSIIYLSFVGRKKVDGKL